MHWKRIKLSQQNLMNYTLQNVATTAALTLYAFISFLPEARSACVLTSGTWECSGSITARILNQSVQSAGPAGHGIYIGTGNLSFHVTSTGVVGPPAATTSGPADGITNYYMLVGYVNDTFRLVNDGRIFSNADMGIQGGGAGSVGGWYLTNNGTITGRTIGVAAGGGSAGVSTIIINNATGIIRGGYIGLIHTNRVGIIENYGEITAYYTGGIGRSSEIMAVRFGGSFTQYNGGVVNGNIESEPSHNANPDTVSILGGAVNGNIYLAGGNDTLLLQDGTITGNIGMDTAAATTGPYESGYSGNDNVQITGGALTGDVYLGAGVDSFTMSGGVGTGIIRGGSGNDVMTLSGGSWTGNIYGDEIAPAATDGNDTFSWTGGAFNGGFYGNNGSDTANISAAGYNGSQMLDGGDDVSTADGFIDVINFSGISAMAPGANLINWEIMNLNASTLTISDGLLEVGDGTSGTGMFLANGSTLDAANALDLVANLSIDPSSTFEATGSGSGIYAIAYNLDNSGTLNMADGSRGDHLSVAGDYTSNGGLMTVDLDFNALAADYMTVDGTVSGTGTIQINDITQAYSIKKGEILLIEETSDTNKADENFVLATQHRYNGDANLGRFDTTPFIWRLKTSGNDWVLGYAFDPTTPTTTTTTTSDAEPVKTSSGKHAVVAEIPAYVSLPTFSYEIANNELDTLHMRLGELRHFRATVGSPDLLGARRPYDPAIEFDPEKLNGWIRFTYASFDFGPDDNFAMDGQYGATNLGFDRKFQFESGALFLGGFGGLSRGDFDNDGRGADYGSLFPANTEIDAWSLGLYGTWFTNSGYYLDLVGGYMGLDTEVSAVNRYQTDGNTLGLSLEAGRSFRLRDDLILEPQAQLKLADVQWDDFFDGWDQVNFEDHTYLTGRLGLRSEYTLLQDEKRDIKPWLYLGLLHEFTDAPVITYVIDFDSHDYDTAAHLQAGITAHLAKRLQLYGDLGLTSDFGDYYSFRFDCGIRYRW